MVAAYIFEREARMQADSLEKNTVRWKTLLYKLIRPPYWIWRKLEGTPVLRRVQGSQGQERPWAGTSFEPPCIVLWVMMLSPALQSTAAFFLHQRDFPQFAYQVLCAVSQEMGCRKWPSCEIMTVWGRASPCVEQSCGAEKGRDRCCLSCFCSDRVLATRPCWPPFCFISA